VTDPHACPPAREGDRTPAVSVPVSVPVSAIALQGIDEIRPGDDLASVIVHALTAGAEPISLHDTDVLVIAHKAVSKSEGALRSLSDVSPSERALAFAQAHSKDPRHVQVVLDQARTILRASHGVIICETYHGFVCANAGVDASNAPGDDTVVLLPADPDGSARALRARLRELIGHAPAIVITDSFGRAWRVGQCDVAIGCAGIVPAEDWRGRPDASGRTLNATLIAVADELAAAADLARRKDGGEPVVLVRGAGRHVRMRDGPGAAALIRAAELDLFR
jgi:coenzyme F420-0:L-glutamate ligase/coenzyme F420-1:gamma-L-glutamate ligase